MVLGRLKVRDGGGDERGGVGGARLRLGVGCVEGSGEDDGLDIVKRIGRRRRAVAWLIDRIAVARWVEAGG